MHPAASMLPYPVKTRATCCAGSLNSGFTDREEVEIVDAGQSTSELRANAGRPVRVADVHSNCSLPARQWSGRAAHVFPKDYFPLTVKAADVAPVEMTTGEGVT